MTNNRTILITGVTGNQGGAVAQALQGAGFSLRGLTLPGGVVASHRISSPEAWFTVSRLHVRQSDVQAQGVGQEEPSIV